MRHRIGLMLFAATASAAFAQAAPHGGEPANAPAAAPRLTLDTPVETIAADPAGRAVLDAVIPELRAHPSYFEFKGMSLNALQPMSDGQITDAMMARLKTELAAIR